jgi:CheY-like chemotaxis protein
MADFRALRQKNIILVVDDVPDSLTLMSSLLREDHKVGVANTGERALRIVQSDNPTNLILLNSRIPGMNGHEVFPRSFQLAP